MMSPGEGAGGLVGKDTGMLDPQFVVTALSVHMPAVVRYAGAVARRLRKYNIAVSGKQSGSALTDALTLADLSLQELLVAALRDSDPIFRLCQIQAEETTGDLARFPAQAPLTIALDPIDGTKQYRDGTGDGYAVMLHLRTEREVLYSLVYSPESGPEGTWVEVSEGRVVCGRDDWNKPAGDVLRGFSHLSCTRSVVPCSDLAGRSNTSLDFAKPEEQSRQIYLIGFQQRDVLAAEAVTSAGLVGVAPDAMPGSIYELMARGDFAGSLIHSPNVYDFPVALHLARVLGGDAVWVHNRQPVHFEQTWLDERADMLRLPGIVACSPHRAVLDRLCEVAAGWNPNRYHDGETL